MKHLLWMLTAATSLVATIAAAAAPSVCSSDVGMVGYETGRRMARGELDAVWQSYGCARFEPFVRDVNVQIGPLVGLSDLSFYCRNYGVAAGLEEVIIEKRAQCEHQCFDDGAGIGRILAQFYCAFHPVDGLADFQLTSVQPPVLCRNASKQECREASTSYVNADCPGLASGEHIASFQEFMNRVCGS